MSAESPRAWGAPLARLDQLWTLLEERLAVAVILTEIFALVAWVSLKALASSSTADGNVIGLIFRSTVTAIVLGTITHLVTRPKPGATPSNTNPIAVSIAVIVGLFAGRLWLGVGEVWCANLIEWVQTSSTFALIGGPRGFVTRLTLWLALLGASLAASRGKHINIDIATRYFPQAAAKPVAILGWAAAAMVCFAAAWGFTDSIAVTKFRAPAFRECPAGQTGPGGSTICETPEMERLGIAWEGVKSDLFLLRRQLELDARTLPRVLAGGRYDDYLTANEWNAWVDAGGWTDYFPKDAVATLMMPTDDPNLKKMPVIVEPGTGEGRDLLIRDLNFVLPFGLLIVGLKFLLRILRALSGHVKIDPNAAHDDEDMKHAHDHDRDVEAAEADVVAQPEGSKA
ncbi:TRAP transporter small permease subunit [Myxococcota bacterium]|nr:TRAP transporter small permease subunit [Myxococcota bacterium]